MTHVTGEDIFDVVEDDDGEGKRYSLVFKSGGRNISAASNIFNTKKFRSKDSALW